MRRNVGKRKRAAHRLVRLPCLERKAELGIDLAGADKAVSMRVDARLDPEQNIGRLAFLCGDRFQRRELFEIVDDDAAYAVVHRHLQFTGRFIVAVEADFFHRESGRFCRVQFPAGNDVQTHVFVRAYAAHFLTAEGFAGKQRQTLFAVIAANGRRERTTVFSYLTLVHHVHGRAVFFCDLHRVDAADGQVVFLIDCQTVGYKHFSLPFQSFSLTYSKTLSIACLSSGTPVPLSAENESTSSGW